MKSIEQEIENLDWNIDKRLQIKAIKELEKIDDRDIGLLIMPRIGKRVWENASKVFLGMDRNRIERIFPLLFEWLMDLNWPGALNIIEVLSNVPADTLLPIIKEKLLEAEKDKDFQWIGGMKRLVDNIVKKNKAAFIDDEIERLLRLSDF